MIFWNFKLLPLSFVFWNRKRLIVGSRNKQASLFHTPPSKLTVQHNEQSYKLFWSFLDLLYFRKITQNDLKHLESFSNEGKIDSKATRKIEENEENCLRKSKGQNGKGIGKSHHFEEKGKGERGKRQKQPDSDKNREMETKTLLEIEKDLKRLIDTKQLNSFSGENLEKSLQKMNYKNLIGQIALTLSEMDCKSKQLKEPDEAERLFQKLFERKYSFALWNSPNLSLKKRLETESQVVRKIKDQSNSERSQKDPSSIEISEQIEELLKTLGSSSKENQEALRNFQKSLISLDSQLKVTKGASRKGPFSHDSDPELLETDHLALTIHKNKILSSNHSPKRSPSKRSGSPGPFEKNEDHPPLSVYSCNEQEALFIYISLYIFILEMKQLADSMSLVTDVRKTQSGFEFEVFFEENMSNDSAWLPENKLSFLNSLREYSLFEVYPISAKCSSPNASHNIAGYEAISRPTISNAEQQQKCYMEWMKLKFASPTQANRLNKALLRRELLEDFKLCHHCKFLLPNAFLVKCNYRSSLMGLPIISNSHQMNVLRKRKKALFDRDLFNSSLEFLEQATLETRASFRKAGSADTGKCQTGNSCVSDPFVFFV